MAQRARQGSSTPKRIRRSLSEWFEGGRIPHPDDPEEVLTYDALLSLRGWGEAEFRHARPEFVSAARFALFAERIVPLMQTEQRIQATSMANLEPAVKGDLARAKMNAAQNIAMYRSALLLDDDG
jgi:hypothetical protein